MRNSLWEKFDDENNFGALNNEKIAEELSKDLKKVILPTFDGKDDVEKLIVSMEKYFHVHQSRALWVAFQSIGESTTWWNN